MMILYNVLTPCNEHVVGNLIPNSFTEHYIMHHNLDNLWGVLHSYTGRHLFANVCVYVSRGSSSPREPVVLPTSTGSTGARLHCAPAGKRQSCPVGGAEENL